MEPKTTFRLVIGGEEIIISQSSIYRLMSFDGLAAAEITLSAISNAIMDGGYVQSARVGMRDIAIKFCIADKNQIEPLRSYLIKFLKPKARAALSVTRGGTPRRI